MLDRILMLATSAAVLSQNESLLCCTVPFLDFHNLCSLQKNHSNMTPMGLLRGRLCRPGYERLALVTWLNGDMVAWYDMV